MIKYILLPSILNKLFETLKVHKHNIKTQAKLSLKSKEKYTYMCYHQPSQLQLHTTTKKHRGELTQRQIFQFYLCYVTQYYMLYSVL